MPRWFGFIDDPVAGGSTFEDLESDPIIVPTTFVPVTSAQVDAGDNALDRNNEVRGRRANVAPISFASAPSLTFEARAYPKLLRKLLRIGLGGSISSVGTGPAAITSTVGPAQANPLPAVIGWLLREGQLDRVTGAWASEVECNFPIDEEGTVTATLASLYHKIDDAAAATDPNGDPALTIPTAAYPGYTETFMLRDAKAFVGATPVELTDLAGFGFTFNNGLFDEFRSRFQPGHNIETTVVDTVTHKVWFPKRHKIGPQEVTGRIDFSDVEPDRDLLRTIKHADKLVFEVAAGKLATTPVVDEMMRLTFYKHVLTGGGAEPLVREGDQFASYEFSSYLSEADGKDLETSFVGATALV